MIAIETLMPDRLILDFRTDEFSAAQYFLKNILKLKAQNPTYNPSIFLSQAAAAILRQNSNAEAKPSLQKHGAQGLVTLENFELDTLLELLFIAKMQRG